MIEFRGIWIWRIGRIGIGWGEGNEKRAVAWLDYPLKDNPHYKTSLPTKILSSICPIDSQRAIFCTLALTGSIC